MGLPSVPTYELNCDMCGGVFESEEAFPQPQYCPVCLRTRLGAAEEVIDACDRFIEIDLPGNYRRLCEVRSVYRNTYGEAE